MLVERAVAIFLEVLQLSRLSHDLTSKLTLSDKHNSSLPPFPPPCKGRQLYTLAENILSVLKLIKTLFQSTVYPKELAYCPSPRYPLHHNIRSCIVHSIFEEKGCATIRHCVTRRKPSENSSLAASGGDDKIEGISAALIMATIRFSAHVQYDGRTNAVSGTSSL